MNYLKALLAPNRLNPILFIGIGLKILSLLGIVVVMLFTDLGADSSDYETETYSSVFYFVLRILSMVLIAPILEELLFDGAFLRSKYFKILSYIALPIAIYVIRLHVPAVLLYLLFCGVSYYDHKTASKKDSLLHIRIVVNALLFSVLHLDFNNLGELWMFSLLSRFAGHLIALWLVLNYKLIYAMGYHFLWNGTIAFILFFNVSFEKDPDVPSDVINNESFCVEYSETAFISKHEVNIRGDKWSCTSCTFETLMEFHGWSDARLFQQKQEGYVYDIEVNFMENFNREDVPKLLEKLSKALVEKEVLVRIAP
ncbi:CPBP family intramembrane metalloprotease [Mangrovimonas sp. TPBH4]|uniref:CPBP family intramembrane metalloprotease n=1 Tax=Mangrovimonas sp. TPBH4 TaxID=1645914 RepID=UPI0006B41DDA|nr:CPBP family intramembrane metalloprotease [Mangrovimonas sp. TPBH4]